MKVSVNIHSPIIISIIASFVWGFFFIYYSSTEGFLVYGDTITHLNIARSVVDNASPGVAQLGGVWLPLLHVLLLPFTSVDSLWRSGFAGSIVGYFLFIFSVLFIYKIGKELLPKVKSAGPLAALIYISNPNILYMSMTAMTEILFIGTVTSSFYFYLKWIADQKSVNLIISSWLILLTTLTRYEGWFLSFGLTIGVFIISLLKPREKFREGALVLFGTVALSGGIGWLLWNLMIFNDPLYFLNSIYSSKYQTLAALSEADKVAYKSIVMSVLTYFWSVYENVGGVLTVGGILGLLFLIYNVVFTKSRKYVAFLIFAFSSFFPYYFLTYAVYSGNVPIHVPQLTHSTFNIRFGMYMIPSMAVLTLLLISMICKKKIALVLVLVLQITFFSRLYVSPVVLRAAMSEISLGSTDMAKWIKKNYTGGKILISSAVGDTVIFRSGLNYSDFITDGSNEKLKLAFEKPKENVSYIVTTKNERDKKRDIVNLEVIKNPKLLDGYQLIYENEKYKLYGKQ